MSYAGGKFRLSKKIHQVLSLVEQDIDNDNNRPILIPFSGLLSVSRKFKGRDITASDINPDLIMMLQGIQNCSFTPVKECSLDLYEQLKYSDEHSALRGYVGIFCSWGGQFYHAYKLKYQTRIDYLDNASRFLEKLQLDIQDIKILDARSYDTFQPDGNMLIYADPPYRLNKLGGKDSYFQTFDHAKFWDTMVEWSLKGNIVVVSERTAPKDWKKIWSHEHVCSSGKSRKATRYDDCLFVHESIYDKLTADVLEQIKTVL
jgi:site-specific DNA-adenine methylase